MLVVVAVDAQQLPIAAVGRVVFVIMVFVVNRQFAQVFSGEITTAFPANPWKQLECLVSIIYFFHWQEES
jgi:putative heme degradation protein